MGAVAPDLLARLTAAPVVAVSPDELESVLAEAEVARLVETSLSGPIRVLAAADRILVQERTPEGQLLLRQLESRADADRFVDDRLAAYERMWDG
jgi:hypothetical protein